MTTATVALCPPLPGSLAVLDVADVADSLRDDARLGGVRVLAPFVPEGSPDDDARTANAHWVAHLAIGLATGGAVAPVLLVVVGEAGALVPALGFSQKASRRAVCGYVLIDAAVPPIESRGGDWPDAPVHFVASPAADPLEANQARLRGWDVVEVPDAAPATLAAAIAAIALRS